MDVGLRYAVVGAGWISQEDFMLSTFGKFSFASR